MPRPFGKVRETPLDVSHCRHRVVDRGALLVIKDCLLDPLSVGLPSVPAGTRAYAGVSLISPTGTSWVPCA